jgi:hypothetical protein
VFVTARVHERNLGFATDMREGGDLLYILVVLLVEMLVVELLMVLSVEMLVGTEGHWD